MMFKAKISKKWEVVIPKEILDDLRIGPGAEITMFRKENKLVMRKA